VKRISKKRNNKEWIMPTNIDRCFPLWKPGGRKWKEERECLACGGKIIYKNDGVYIAPDTAAGYDIEPGWYHLSFLLGFHKG